MLKNYKISKLKFFSGLNVKKAHVPEQLLLIFL